MQFICYPKCTTCQKASKFLTANGLEPEVRNISTSRPSAQELEAWHKLSGLPIRKFFNTSGQSYRALSLKDKLDNMTTEACIELLASDGMLVKRPILIHGDTVLVGFNPEAWTKGLL